MYAYKLCLLYLRMKQAVVLCSGGIDSAVTAYYVKRKLKYGKIVILFFNYGQKSLLNERKFSKLCASSLKAEFKEIKLLELARLSTSLINIKGKVKRLNRNDLKNTARESKKWYVPFRNTIFLSYALSLAECIYLKDKIKSDIFVGFKCEGQDHFPDTTKSYLKEMNKLTKTASYGFKIIAPLIDKDKEDIILLGSKLGVDFRKTFSCYLGKRQHCGYCLACKLRQEGFYWSGLKDPTYYISKD